MGAGALTICHNKAAVQIKEDMKRMVQMPILKPRSTSADRKGVFGLSLLEVDKLGLADKGVPLVVRSMVEFLREHGLEQEGLFRVNGSVRAVDGLKERLEREEDVRLGQEVDVCAVASLLKQFLRDLPEGLVLPAVQSALLKRHQELNEDGCSQALRALLQDLPAAHYSLLKYLCHFLTEVEQQHKENRMTALNLATVFGPNVFHVSAGLDGIQEQNICNKIMTKLIQNYSNIFETDTEPGNQDEKMVETNIITVKEAQVNRPEREKSPYSPTPNARTPVPRKKKAPHSNQTQNADESKETSSENRTVLSRKKKVKRVKGATPRLQSMPEPSLSAGVPQSRPLPQALQTEPAPCTLDTSPTTHTAQHRSPSPKTMEVTPHSISLSDSGEYLNSLQEEDRPISPFYMSSQIFPGQCRPDLTHFVEKTIHFAVEQHLFDGPHSSPAATARQRRRHQREQEEALRLRHGDRECINKENNPSPGVVSSVCAMEDGLGNTHKCKRLHNSSPTAEGSRHRKAKHDFTLAELKDNQESLKERFGALKRLDRGSTERMESENVWSALQKQTGASLEPSAAMKIQEAVGSDPADGCEDVPRLDLSALTEDNWGDPVPAYSSWQRESMDREEARLSPHAGGCLIRQLLEEGSDPMVSPRFYAYGHSQQYLDDTEVPPSPPNAHFVSRRRSSSLGSCDEDREELTSAQLSKKIHSLKRKIRKFEEKFEDERKYRPSHGDKAANPEVLRWMNELAKLRKDLKDHKLLKSEEDLTPMPRQRSNTLPKSFGSQLEKKPVEPKTPKPPVEATLESVMAKLEEKRKETGRPEDIKDMTREQIGAEKVALQKALLYYESIHGRPVTKTERQIMKPLYDRYRLVKQILCRASTIPVIGSPSSKRRGPLLQPIIEGVPALFFDDIKQEEDGSDDDGETKTQVTVSVKPELSMLGILEQLDEEVDGFISPVDELSPSKNTTDMRLSNLHSATTQELVEQLQEAREEKKRIRKNLREFEDQFFRQNGRNVQKEDRSPLAVEYNEYKHIKAKLRLLEVLISKRDSSKFI
ncbi:protein FAM13A isoform X2 [Denticeps clupeoides]|uniref:Rho-GAP domain-containing protein n=1 Tax=Denticeps clupeoides TaxID=299321 RepID=A0AAY4ALA9_9TELE|nr:protein FAM13A isoform X2 [Denticeps clupeoides]